MAFQLSPGVAVTEEDRTTIIPSVATTSGGFAGAFQWGPVEEVTTVDTENNLVSLFGKPNDTTAGYFFTAANFLSYGNNLKLVRVIDAASARNAVSTPSGTVTSITANASANTYTGNGIVNSIVISISSPTFGSGVRATANAILSSYGTIGIIDLTSGGFGYNTVPTVSIIGGSFTNQATANIAIGAGEVSNIYVLDAGNNYTSLSNVVIQNQDSTGARANLVVHFKLQDLKITNGGEKYGPQANIVFSGNIVPGGIHATAALTVVANVITGYTITTSGNGYLAFPNVTINRNDGNTGADASITGNVGYGYLNLVTITNPGVGGYSSAPTVTINRNNTLGGANAAVQTRIKAAVTSITISNAGNAYFVNGGNPTIIITPAVADDPFISSHAAANAFITFPIQSITMTNNGSGYTSTPTVTLIDDIRDSITAATAVVTLRPPVIKNGDDYDTNYSSGGFLYNEFAAKYPGILGNSIKVSMADGNTFATWQYRSQFDSTPSTSSYVSSKGGSNDEIHIIVLDATGDLTGVVGSVLEKYSYLSKASDAKNVDGSTNYYKNVINNQSAYLWVLDHPSVGTDWGTDSKNNTFVSLSSNVTSTLSGGASGDSVSTANVLAGYNLFSNDELYDVSLIPMGPTTAVAAVNTVIGIAESRRDAVVFASPQYTDVVNTTGQADKIVSYRNSLTASSYAVLDSGWKYQYDRYNDKYRYVPLNGDIAGLAARTDYVADPWFSPAGYNRGVIKNLVKLAYSPTKTDRDTLYKNGINPVVTFPGQGTLLFGDKTLLARPSAFDRINVRRLFMVLEKSIATASKFQLFEFNDAFTRGQFKNIVEPFLRDVQGRRGITDFRVICDESNNTPGVIDRNEFVADIFIKPSRAINFIQLNFIATRSGIAFEEVGA
jgi:phage tail sheath protein FI